MRQTAIQLLKNTSIIYAVEIVSRVLALIFTIYAARVMGVKGFGDFSYALAVFAIVAVISDLGASNLLVKLSAQKASVDKDFWAFTVLRTTATIATIALVTLYLYFSNAENEVIYFSLLMGAGMVFGCYGQNIGFVFRGFNRMHIDGLIRISQSFFTVFLGLLALRFGLGLPGVGGAYFFAYVFSSLIALRTNSKTKLIRTFPPIVSENYLSLIKKSAPFLLWMLLSVVYAKIDTILLLHLKGANDVGLYSAAGKIVEALLIIPSGIFMGMLPIMSSLMAEKDMKSLESLSHLTIKYMTYIGFFIACYIAFSSDKVIELLYFSGQYKEAVRPLQILAWSAAASFFYITLVAIIVSSAVPRAAVWLSVIASVLIIFIDIIVIPIWGVIGASAAKLLVELVNLLLVVLFVNKFIVRIKYMDFIIAGMVSSLVLAIFMSFVRSLLFLPIYFLVYIFMLYLVKGVSKEEFEKIRELIKLSFKKE